MDEIEYFRDKWAKNCGGSTHLPSMWLKNCPFCGIKLPTIKDLNDFKKGLEPKAKNKNHNRKK